jgi:hypothetical protein
MIPDVFMIEEDYSSFSFMSIYPIEHLIISLKPIFLEYVLDVT